MQTKPSVTSVHSFWNTAACGTHFVEQYENEWDFFDRYREHRYCTEWHIPLLVPFADAKGKTRLPNRLVLVYLRVEVNTPLCRSLREST